MKKLFKILSIVIGVLVILLIALVQKIDRTPYTDSRHYAQWKEWIGEKAFTPTIDSFRVGWAKTVIMPDFSAPMSGYGKRRGKHFEAVRDSLYVRALSVMTPDGVLTFVSADLLIIPPNVTVRLEKLIQADGISLDELHLGATHTHHSVGGWGQKLLGRLFAGKYDERIEILLAESLRTVILESRQQAIPGTVQYRETDYGDGIKNRLKVDDPMIKDPEIRSLIFRRADSTDAVMLVYGAHTTILPSDLLVLSRDFPGHTIDSLEATGDIDFALYFAGAVGSMGFDIEGETAEERSQIMGERLAGRFLEDEPQIPAFDSTVFFLSEWVPVPLPAPTFRINLNYALRPWVFNMLFGSSPGDIKVSLLGTTLLLGMPADFSGEIMVELDEYARSRGLDLIVTSFNGNYMGYITHDRHYEKDLYETVTMSWNGYQAGDYYTRVARDIIDGVSATLNGRTTPAMETY